MSATKILSGSNPGSDDNLQTKISDGIHQKADSRPIMGFLYSVSHTPSGEFWPVYLGLNRIGCSPQCEVSLREDSVSESHATLVIRKMPGNRENTGLFVFLQDIGSTCGTMLNGVLLDFNPKECKSGDIIGIGKYYELYLVLIDADALGLKPKTEFKPTAEAKHEEPADLFTNPFKGSMGANASSPFNDTNKKTVLLSQKKQ